MPEENGGSRVDRETQLANAALRLLAQKEWRSLTLAAVARSAKLPLRDVLGVVPSKAALPAVVLRALARETMYRHSPDSSSGGARERLFDVVMSWFDVQQQQAPALKALYGALRVDPATLFAMRGDILRLSGEFLALAEADFGASGGVQSVIVTGVLARAVSAWRDDDDAMGKTMARLDGDLQRVERFLWPDPGGAARASPKCRKRGNKRGAEVRPAGESRPGGRRGGSRRV